jgi:predicted DCC family thiol-disulfide oxidoreductase YuxK
MDKPLLIYDGDCGFCNYWAQYWRKLTGDRVDYAPYQEAGGQYPDISQEEFKSAVQYIAPDGTRARAAEASFRTLSHAPGKAFWLTLYRYLPGFAWFTELAYALIAAHRPFFHHITLLLWGRNYAPPRYDLASWLFLRALALIYLAAFASFGVQAMGLIGSGGILPLQGFVEALEAQVGPERYWYVPMVFWLGAGDLAIQAVCWAGAGLAVMLLFNILPRLSLLLMYVLYLSLLYGGQAFMTYQWDIFLVEAGFLALVMSISQRPGIWLLRFLLFRFMFMSGVVKLLSGDPNWANLSALSYHFLTQPLPTPLAWYAGQLPAPFLVFLTASMFVIELVLPFFIFLPRRLRFVAGFGFLLLQVSISLTGNYNFFNLQTMVLTLLLFDDAALEKIVPRALARSVALRAQRKKEYRAVSVVAGAGAVLLTLAGLVQMHMGFGGAPPSFAIAASSAIAPLRIVNNYGLFAVMTTKRHEIVIEGSMDGVEWKEYEFKYKPGLVTRWSMWNIPHQPRLDWQMWFAALGNPQNLPWFPRFLQKLLENAPAVVALMEKNPFPDAPPIYIRALFYDYTFPTSEESRQGIAWHRELVGTYFPQASLSKR